MIECHSNLIRMKRMVKEAAVNPIIRVGLEKGLKKDYKIN